MKYLASILTLFFCQFVHAATQSGLERINFYPKVSAYLTSAYSNQNLSITTPRNAVDDTEVTNNRNVFSLTYAYFLKKLFLGATVIYEAASESAANYGIPSSKNYSSQGFKEPAIFILTRLREQSGSTGNIDFYLSFTDSLGAREIGGSTSNRLHGRNTLTSIIGHGMLEDKWEFKNALQWTFFDEGDEHNKFQGKQFQLGSYNLIKYSFTGQYQINPWLFINASAEFEYRTVQKIRDETGTTREIQAGTGSIFSLGAKKPLSDWAVIEIKGELERHDYFILGESNFDGEVTQTTYTLSYVQGF